MSKLSGHIGGRIRLYRQKKKITIEQLAKAISKSSSTISKYEQGTIVIDVESLFDLAKALNVSVHQLIDYVPPGADGAKAPMFTKVLDLESFYMYFYDGRRKKLVRGYIESRDNPLESGNHVILYLDFDSYDQYSRCQFLYSGRMHKFDTLSYISLENQSNHVERLNITILDSFRSDDIRVGHLSGISNQPYTPVSFKVIISGNRLDENDELVETLKLCSEDFRLMKKMNMFTVTRPV